MGGANWHAAQGTIMADAGQPGFLVTRKSYRDFQIRAEFWAEPTTNSGIFLRAQDRKKIVVVLNGVQTVDVQNGKFAQGPFALQYAAGANNIQGGAIKWRKLQVREL